MSPLRLLLLCLLVLSATFFFAVVYWTRGSGGVYATLIGMVLGTVYGLVVRWWYKTRRKAGGRS